MATELLNEVVAGGKKEKVTFPRLLAPSCSCRVAFMTPPGKGLAAVKVKLRETEAPPWTTTPYATGSLGEVTPLPARRVATRFAELSAPAFVRVSETVTVSPGSTAALRGEKLSAASVAPAARMMGAGLATVTRVVTESLALLVSIESMLRRATLVST